ncbi:MAG: hypothetical protein AABX94_02815, partial [Nanoarchaeota archaeon]
MEYEKSIDFEEMTRIVARLKYRASVAPNISGVALAVGFGRGGLPEGTPIVRHSYSASVAPNISGVALAVGFGR